MNETSKIVADTIRSMVRIGFLTGLLYFTVHSFDSDEAKIIAGYAAAESGLRGLSWLGGKKEE